MNQHESYKRFFIRTSVSINCLIRVSCIDCECSFLYECCFPDELSTCKITVIIILFVLAMLFMSCLIIGQLYKNDCPIEPRVSAWLTVSGAVGLPVFVVLCLIVRIHL